MKQITQEIKEKLEKEKESKTVECVRMKYGTTIESELRRKMNMQIKLGEDTPSGNQESGGSGSS